MYINKIDEIIDKIIDDFYSNISKNPVIQKLYSGSEINFVKYQSDINKILSNYIKNIDKTEINSVIQDPENTKKIIEIIKRYIAYYIFLLVAFFYKAKPDIFINNIVEFTKNQPNFNFKIENFFNSESNSIIIKFFELIKKILLLINSDSTRLNQYIKKPEFIPAINFLNGLGQDFILKNFKLENLNGNIQDQAHNIIKTIILTELYYKIDKNSVYQYLEKTEKQTGEYIYIDIVIPRTEYIDYNTIELSLSPEDVASGLAVDIYDLIISSEQTEKLREKNHDEKILDLINHKILIPITEDFLLYHKDSEKYEKPSNIQQTTNLKKKRKIPKSNI